MKKLLKIAPFVFYVLLAIFLYFYLKSIDYSQFANISIAWEFLVVATIFDLVTRYWGGYVWYSILNQMSSTKIKHFTELMYVYAKSWMARYIPGSVAWIVSKVYFASKYGISKNKLAVSSLLEAGLQVTVVMASAIVLLMLDSRFALISDVQKALMFAALAGCVVVLIPPVFNRIVAILYKIIKKKPFDKEHYITTRLVLRSSGLYLLWSLLGGIALFFIAKAVYPELGYDNMLFIMGVGSLSGALGMLAFFTPSGLGVKEGVQIVLLGLVMPTEFALVISVAMRLWSVVVDFLFFGSTFATQKLRNYRSK